MWLWPVHDVSSRSRALKGLLKIFIVVVFDQRLLPELHKAETTTLYLVHRSDQNVWTLHALPPSTNYWTLATSRWNLPSPFPEVHDEWTWKH